VRSTTSGCDSAPSDYALARFTLVALSQRCSIATNEGGTVRGENGLSLLCARRASGESRRMTLSCLLFALCFFVSTQKQVPFEPVMVCDLGPTIGIARYLSRLLQPIYDQVASSITFCKEAEAVYTMEMYAKKGSLLPTTLLATIRIRDACTSVPHTEIM
jgi:hypothetical protein